MSEAFWAFISFILNFWVFISFHFGILGLFGFHFLSFWPFGFSFPLIVILGLHKFVQVLAVAATIYNKGTSKVAGP